MLGLTETAPAIETLACNQFSHIRHVIAVMSGKGGVGKSSVAALLAVEAARDGMRVGVLDADITGPSIPRMFGLKGQPDATDIGIIAPRTRCGIRVMSLNLFMSNEDDPVVWRGPLMASAVKQFWTDVVWGDLEYLFVDLPPGTGDSPLTVMQSLPLDGVVVVTSPQDLAAMVVRKAVKMAQRMNIPLLGVVENMSHVICPGCGKSISIFGQPQGRIFADRVGAPLLGSLPIDPDFALACDSGTVEDYNGEVRIKSSVLHEELNYNEVILSRAKSQV